MKYTSTASVIVASFGVAATLLWACSSSTSNGGNTNTNTNTDSGSNNSADSGPHGCTDLQVLFSPMYSAFVAGQHSFQIPSIVQGVTSGLTWTASDTTAVKLDPFDNGGTLITVLKETSAPVTITAYAGDPSAPGTKCGSSILTITPGTETEWKAGSDRYNNGNYYVIPDGGLPTDAAGIDAGNLACTNCHGPTATNLPLKTVSHTPEQAGGFSDDELLNIITKGVVPDAGYFDDSIVDRGIFATFHTWHLTTDERTGIVLYLRSLTPAPQGGKLDFGGGSSVDSGTD